MEKVIRKLSSKAPVSEVQGVYQRGHSLIVGYKEHVLIFTSADLKSIPITGSRKGIQGMLKSQYFLDEMYNLWVLKGKHVVLDQVKMRNNEILAVVKPFTGQYDEIGIEFYLYNDNGTIANEVYEAKKEVNFI